jgi:hypothetical protein
VRHAYFDVQKGIDRDIGTMTPPTADTCADD